MIRKYNNRKRQTTPWHCKEEPPNHHETPGRQIKQSNQPSLPHQHDCNTRMDVKQRTTKHRTITDSNNGSNNKQKVNNNRTTVFTKPLMLCISERYYDCGSIILNASIDNGLIKSPDFDGDGLYENNLECSWTIKADIDKIVQLFILEFQLEKDYWCRFDNLKVC